MKIAIQANPSRGKEIISLLESLGGIKSPLEGNGESYTYYIDEHNVIRYCDAPTNYKVYTLEEFEEEFPFKIGDLCIYSSDILNEDIVVRVLGMTMTTDCIMYEVGHRDITREHSYIYKKRETLKPFKEMKEERNITLTLDKAKEWYKKGGELKEIALQAFSEKELTVLPKSWEEYCMTHGCVCLSARYTNISTKYDALIKLEQLRDCWRQDWKPNWNSGIQPKYCVYYYRRKFDIAVLYETSHFLSFPTKEMAEEFLKCFRDLIEKAGDLI